MSSICPNCGMQVDYFLYSITIKSNAELRLQEDSFNSNQFYVDYVHWKDESSDLKFRCPKCKEVLFIDEPTAKQFLEEGMKNE